MNQIKTTKYFLFLLFFVLISCQRIDKPTILKDNDTIKYYSDFDPFLMKPMGSMNDKPMKYPYCEVHYSENRIKDIVFHRNKFDSRKRVFLQKGGKNRAIEHFHYAFEQWEIDTNFITIYTYSYKIPCDISLDSGSCDSLSWLTALTIMHKNKIESYYFSDEDSIPKYCVPSIVLKHNNILKLKQLDAYDLSLITETQKEIIIRTNNYEKKENGLFEESFIQYNKKKHNEVRHNKDSIGSKNWAVYY